MCADVSVLLAGLSLLPAVFFQVKQFDPLGSQVCLWAMQSRQAECLQGGMPLHTH